MYANALDYVFRDDDLKNVAITGAYSSGKSIMLKTYKAANEDKKFIHISLAHFETAINLSIESDDYSQGVEVDKKTVEKKIPNQQFQADIKCVEGKILNQLIQIDSKEIPQTHFKIKHPFSSKTMLEISAMLTLFLSFLFFLLNRTAEPSDIFGPSISRWLEFINILLSKGGFTS